MTVFAERSHPPLETYGSDSFRLEYSPNTPEKAIKKDVESLLGEYVFELPSYNYELLYENGKLLDPNTQENMSDKTIKAIDLRNKEGKNISREYAEYEGFLMLEEQLKNADAEDLIVWMSPPGQKEEGYGDYGFVYLGKTSSDSLKMTALRVEEPSLDDFSSFFNTLTNSRPQFSKAEDFLANPLVISGKESWQIRNSLQDFFIQKSATANNAAFIDSLRRLSPYIDKYLEVVQTGGTKKFEQQVFNMLLNYSIVLRDSFNKESSVRADLPFITALERYGNRVPILAGSCGSTGSSNNIFNSLSPLAKILSETEKKHWDYHNGDCVVCSKRNAEVGPCNICKDCEKKFD